MEDLIFKTWLETQQAEGRDLAENSDVLTLLPLPDGPPPFGRFLAMFSCTGLVRTDAGGIAEAHEWAVGIGFPGDYLRTVSGFQVVTWLGPGNAWHPNIRPPHICLGRLRPGTGLVEILDQILAVITYRKVTMREDDCLNPDACTWARNNRHRFPLDSRPLRRQPHAFTVEVIGTGGDVP